MSADRIVVNVTQKHIDEGRRNYSDSCAIAHALMDAGYDLPWVIPGGSGIRGFVSFKEDAYSRDVYALSRRANAFAHRFDKGNPVSPSRFVFLRSE